MKVEQAERPQDQSVVLCCWLSLSPFVERPVSLQGSIILLHPVSGNPPYYREKNISLLHVSYASPEAMQKIGRKKIWINLISNSQPCRWPLGASKSFGRPWTDSYVNSSAFHHQHQTALCSQDREKADFLQISLLA